MFFKATFLLLFFVCLLYLGNCIDSFKKATEKAKKQAIDVRQAVDLEAYITNLLNKQLLPSDYNKNIRPNYGGKPVQMNLSLMINDISSITETSMDYKVIELVLNFKISH